MNSRTVIVLVALLASAAHSSAAVAQGYSGLIAPAPSAADTGTQEQPPGYEGLISGKTPQKQSTPAGQAPDAAPINSDQLKQKAELDRLSAEDAAALDPVPEKWTGDGKRTRIGDDLPEVYSTRRIVDSYMAMVSDKNLPAEQKKKNASAVYKHLVTLQDGFRAKKAIPDVVYQKMGVPAGYLQDEREATEKSLKIIASAIETVRDMQK